MLGQGIQVHNQFLANTPKEFLEEQFGFLPTKSSLEDVLGDDSVHVIFVDQVASVQIDDLE